MQKYWFITYQRNEDIYNTVRDDEHPLEWERLSQEEEEKCNTNARITLLHWKEITKEEYHLHGDGV
jgi:hypothetical protein